MDVIPVRLLTMAANELIHSSAKAVDFLFYKRVNAHYTINNPLYPPIVDLCMHYDEPALCVTDRRKGVRAYAPIAEDDWVSSNDLLRDESIRSPYLKPFTRIKEKKTIAIAVASFKRSELINKEPITVVEVHAKDKEPYEIQLNGYDAIEKGDAELALMGYPILMEGRTDLENTLEFFKDVCSVPSSVVREPEERRRALWYNLSNKVIDASKLEELTALDLPDDVGNSRTVAFPARTPYLANFNLNLQRVDFVYGRKIVAGLAKPSTYGLVDLGNYWRDKLVPEIKAWIDNNTCFMLYKASLKQRR